VFCTDLKNKQQPFPYTTFTDWMDFITEAESVYSAVRTESLYKTDQFLDFCLTVHHQLGKVIQMNQLDATMIY